MNRVSWSVEGIEPAVRERAEAAARRAGMSLADWINGQLGDTAPQPRAPEPARTPAKPAMAERNAGEVAEIHQRLDTIARQIEHISRTPARGEPPVARQLNDAISRLDARLARITEPKPAARPSEPQSPTERVERAAAQVYHSSPTLDPNALDKAIAEIAARQSELDAAANWLPRQPSSFAPPIAPSMAPPQQPAGPDFSSLEQQLLKITGQIDALQRPTAVEQSIAAFRTELAEIRQTITEAMPRKAIESLEGEIRSLARRLDETRQNGSDTGVIAGIERALGDIHAALRSLTPAEQLAGFDDAIRNLGGKIDMIVRNSDDPGTVQQLENAINALRGIVSNVASNEALAQLSDNVRTLADKIDQLTQGDGHGVSFTALEQRISALTAALESRERSAPSESSEQLESAVRALSERIDHLPVGADSQSAFAHLEQRVSHLLERMEAVAEQRGGGGLGRVEDGLHDILRMLERQQANFVALAEMDRGPGSGAQADPALVDSIKRELSDLRFSQSESERHTQDSLEAVHSTLGHVVDRLAMIEGDLRTARAAPPLVPAPEPVKPAFLASAAPIAAAPPVPNPAASAAPSPLPPRPELPNPAAETFAAAPRDFVAGKAPAEPAPAPKPLRAIHDILDPPARRIPAGAEPTIEPSRSAVDVGLPPDHPLEPGTRPPGRVATPSERIAASESAISELAAGQTEPASTTNFIAAARRAAQAAASVTSSGGAKAKADAKPAPDGGKPGSTLGTKIKSLLVGASVVVIVLSSFKMAMKLFDSGEAPPVASISAPAAKSPPPGQPSGDSDSETAPEVAPAAPPAAAPTVPPPSMISPTPVERQSLYAPPPKPASPPARAAEPAPMASPSADVTGTIPTAQPSAAPVKFGTIAIPAHEQLPDIIGGAGLRTAALKGDAAAAYEIATRFAEGKGVAVNYDEAAKWYARAADAGVTPAIFRIGTFYEKGLGVKKDLDTARRYYSEAADRGNAKAMHNLAVLYADGGSAGANYKTAAAWFRKAAEHGVADSQFNLGILYARGIGVDQNLAESYKWFTLAAAQGDADAGRKRDDVAKRLDPQSLAAAKLAIQTFSAEPQPDAATKVAAPAGGWDAQTTAAAKRNTARRAAR
jgi:localization factor PodJL